MDAFLGFPNSVLFHLEWSLPHQTIVTLVNLDGTGNYNLKTYYDFHGKRILKLSNNWKSAEVIFKNTLLKKEKILNEVTIEKNHHTIIRLNHGRLITRFHISLPTSFGLIAATHSTMVLVQIYVILGYNRL